MADSFGQLGSVSVAVIADLAGLRPGFDAGKPIASKYGQQLGTLFSAELSKAIGNVDLKKFSSSLQSIASQGKTIGAALSIGLTAPLAAIGAAGLAASATVGKALREIRVDTGATGERLAGLTKDFNVVFANAPESAHEVAIAIGELNRRADLSGPALQHMAEQLLNVSRITKGDISANVQATTRLFDSWNIATEKQADGLDFLFKVSQATGIGFTRLNELLVQFKVPLQQLGFGFKESAAILGQFEKSGVNVEQAMTAMKLAITNLSKAGVKDTGAALGVLINQIKAVGTEAEANALGIKIFGARAGVELVAAIRKGRIEVDELVKSLDASKETINGAAEETLTFSDKVAKLGNRMAIALTPIGNNLKELMSDWIPVAEKGIAIIATLVKGFGDLPKPVQLGAVATAALLAALGPIVLIGASVAGSIGSAALALTAYTATTATAATATTLTAGEIALLGGASTTAAGGMTLAATATKLLGGALTAIPWLVIAGSIAYLAKAVYDLNTAMLAQKQASKDAASADDILAEKLKQRGVNLKYLDDALKQGTITQEEYHSLLHDEVQKLTSATSATNEHADAVGKSGKAAKLSAEDQAALAKALADQKEKHDKAAQAAREHAEAAARFNEEVARQKAAITGISAPTDEFVHALHELDDQGKLDAETILRLRHELENYRESNDPLIQKLRQLIPSLTATELAYSNLKDAAEQLGAVQRDLASIPIPRLPRPEPETAPGPMPANLPTERTVKSLEELKRLEKVPAEVGVSIRQMQEAGASAAEIIEVMGSDIEQAARVSRELGIPLDENTKILLKQIEAAKESARVAEDWRRAWATAVGNIVSKFSDGVTEMILSGKDFSVKLKSIFADLGKSLIKILVTDAFGFIAKQFSGLVSSLFSGKGGAGGLLSNLGGSALSKLLPGLGIGGATAAFGGTALAGTAGGIALTSGPAAGLAIASAPTAVGGIAGGGAAAGVAGGATFLGMSVATAIPVIGGAIAAALVASHYIGQGRRTANEFVQGAQNPFGENLGKIVDAFNEAVAAGKITSDQAVEAKDDVMKLWSTFRTEADKFAAQGATQAKVVRQAYETLDPLVAQITKDMDASIENIKQKEAVAYKETLKTQVQDQHDAIDMLRKEIDYIRTDPSFDQKDPVVQRLLEELTGQLDDLTGVVKSNAKTTPSNQQSVLEELQARRDQIKNLKEQIEFLKKIAKGDPVAQKLLAELNSQLASATASTQADRTAKAQPISLQMLRDAEDAAYAKGFGVGQNAYVQRLPQSLKTMGDAGKNPTVQAGPMQVNVTSSYSPTLTPTITVNGKELSTLDIRNQIIPEIFGLLQTGGRGYQQELVELVANRLKGVTSKQSITGI